MTISKTRAIKNRAIEKLRGLNSEINGFVENMENAYKMEPENREIEYEYTFSLFLRKGFEHAEETTVKIGQAIPVNKNESANIYLIAIMNGIRHKFVTYIKKITEIRDDQKIECDFHGALNALKEIDKPHQKKTDVIKQMEGFNREEDTGFIKSCIEVKQAIKSLSKESTDHSTYLGDQLNNFAGFFVKLNKILEAFENLHRQKA